MVRSYITWILIYPGHCGKLCAKMNTNYLAIDYPGVGRSLIFLGFHFVLFFLILLGTESNQANRARRRGVTGRRMDVDPMEDMDDEPGQDSDVRAETKRVLETPLPDLVKEDILVLKQVVVQIRLSLFLVLLWWFLLLSCF